MSRLLSAFLPLAAVTLALIGRSAPVPAGTDWFVAPMGRGPGSAEAPFGTVQAALSVAQPGDRVRIRPGTYDEALRTVRGGDRGAPITVMAEAGVGSVTVTSRGRVLTVSHPWIVVQGLTFDGAFGPDDTVRILGAAEGAVIRDCEVRRSGADLIAIGPAVEVVIERCRIHHALNGLSGRVDAHGIVAGAVRRLTIRDVEIHTFSGDGIQIDPGRSAPGWDQVSIEGTRIWLAPLDADVQGFPAGLAPGENAIDTKASPAFPRASIVMRDIDVYGFRHGHVTNMAAFNLKEHVDAVIDGVTVRDSEIAFRLRGPSGGDRGGARVRVQNAVLYDVETGVRHEDGLADFRMWHSTFGQNIRRPFQSAGARSGAMDLRNLLFLGQVPAVAADRSNRSASTRDFVNAPDGNYALAAGSRAIDAGVTIAEVAIDRAGIRRPQGRAPDVGAFERR